MMNIGAIKSSGGMAGYMTSSESQLAIDEFRGVAWGGELASELGLQGTASKDEIAQILEGYLPGGGVVGQRIGENGEPSGLDERQRKGTELIFSMPKSVSILAVTGKDERLLRAFNDSVKRTMAYAERSFAEARIKEKGEVRTEKTGKLIYAEVMHGYDDAGNPHGHKHVAVANVTRTADGQYRSLDNSKIFENSALIGTVQSRDFADRVRALGYEIKVDSRGKSWDVVAVPDAVKEANATRSADIKTKMAEEGRTGYGSNRIARFETRENLGKDISPEILDERNRARDAELGFDAQGVVAQTLSRQNPATIVGKVRQTVTQVYKRAIDRHDQRSDFKLLDSPYLPGNIRSLTQSSGAALSHVAVASAIHHHEQREAAFKERDVKRYALDLQHQGVTIESVEAVLDGLKAQGLVITGEKSPYITTRDSLAREHRIIDNIVAARDKAVPVMAREDVRAALEPHLRHDEAGNVMELNDGQMAAAQLLLSSTDGIGLIQGFSGTGKTSTIAPVARALAAANSVLQEQGKQLYGLAPSRRAVEELEAVGLEATTITAFLNDNGGALAGDTQAIAAARAKWQGAHIIIDKSSMQSNRDFEKLTQLYHLLGLNRMDKVGDSRQLQAVDAGKAFEWVQYIRDVASATLDRVVRQKVPDLKQFNELIRVGESEKAFDVIAHRMVEAKDYVGEASGRFLALPTDERARTLLVTAGNEDRRAANNLVQQGLKGEGILSGPGQIVTVLDGKGLTDEQHREKNRYAVGDVLRVSMRSDSLNLRRGDYDVVGTGRTHVKLLDSAGRLISIDPRRFPIQRDGEAISLMEKRGITIHEGERIRWTANENRLGLVNGKEAEIKAIDAEGLTIATDKGEDLKLGWNDPQARNFDLAYAVNANKVQGATAYRTIWAALTSNKLLATMRQAYVNGTRATHDLTVITDDLEKLRALVGGPNSDKTAAIEVTGELQAMKADAQAREFNAKMAGFDINDPTSVNPQNQLAMVTMQADIEVSAPEVQPERNQSGLREDLVIAQTVGLADTLSDFEQMANAAVDTHTEAPPSTLLPLPDSPLTLPAPPLVEEPTAKAPGSPLDGAKQQSLLMTLLDDAVREASQDSTGPSGDKAGVPVAPLPEKTRDFGLDR